jgi:hypothetical protein
MRASFKNLTEISEYSLLQETVFVEEKIDGAEYG